MRTKSRSSWVLVSAAGGILAAGCAGNPAPGEKGYPFNLDGAYDAMIEVQGMPYTGVMTLRTGSAGAVTGELRFTSPVEVTGTVTGTIADSTFTFQSPYIRDMGCEGTVFGEAVVARGGGGASGPAEVADDCAGGVMEGRFQIGRADAP